MTLVEICQFSNQLSLTLYPNALPRMLDYVSGSRYIPTDMEREINVLGTLAMALTDEIRSATSEVVGMSGETAAAIITVGANPGVTVGQVAHALALTPSGTARLVDRLVSEGYLTRQHGRDQRTVTLELSSEGENKRLLALKQRDMVIRRALSGLESGDIRILGQIIDRMFQNIMVRPDQDNWFCRMCDEDACVPHCPVENRKCELEQQYGVTSPDI